MLIPQHMRIKRRATSEHDKKRGAALFTVMLFSVAAGGMTMVLTSMASTADIGAQLQYHKLQAEYLAEAGIEAVRAEIQSTLVGGGTPPSNGTVVLNGASVTYTVTVETPERTVTDHEGIHARVVDYRVTTRSEADGAVAMANGLLRSRAVVPYQFAVFYDTDAWMTTATTLFIDGRFHVNGDLYIGAGAGHVFLDTNYVRTAQNYYGYRLETLSQSASAKLSVSVRKWVQDPFDSSEPKEFTEIPTILDFSKQGIASSGGLDSDFLGYDADGDGALTGPDDYKPLAEWLIDESGEPDHYHDSGVTFQTAEHGVTEIAAPERSSSDPYEPSAHGDYIQDPITGSYVQVASGTGTHAKGKLFSEAGLSILRDADGSWTVFDHLGFDVTAQAAPAISDYSFYDAYRQGTMDVIDVDIEALTSAGLFPDNGLIYYSGEGASESAGKGLQLSNGAELEGPLTVASETVSYTHLTLPTICSV